MLSVTEIKKDLSDKKNVIFVPFSATENNFSLYFRALTWRQNLRDSNKHDKIPEIVMYRHPDETNEEYEEYDVHFQFSAENLPTNTTVYVIADGTGNPGYVTNTNQFFYQKHNDTPSFLPVEAIAWRMMQCGLTPELAQNLKVIKLYICDENDSNQKMALNFAYSLGEFYSEILLNFYKARLNIPMFYSLGTSPLVARKYGEIFSIEDGVEQLIESGFASQYRKDLLIRDALHMVKDEEYEGVLAERQRARAFENTDETSRLEEQISSLTIAETEYSGGVLSGLLVESLDDDSADEAGANSQAPFLLIEDLDDDDSPTAISYSQSTALIVWSKPNSFSFFTESRSEQVVAASSTKLSDKQDFFGC
ncbi:hypothetical protein BN59_02328 [Legionella massiliensis]|uniref:Uncharacterized protein n=1 Tax=Legionella massiliensis TaxID=1034943 RepID=A0A078KYN0_9GAMM|nr:hypothetical protein [Legionella massiliensis]CDZ78031.1 hypothetical protein BN59_02328 [Legionella massiliensis]CEE13769.1 hypothetical protein BN1094_02328 [Legionella massiliensis]